MSGLLVVLGSVGVACSVMGLVVLGMVLAREGRWSEAVIAVGAMAMIVFLAVWITDVSPDMAQDFWRSKP